jgi:23S rRNA (guanine2445-N2)-methyltransferase / 23S rRNA (guanine2069-N7)-methyltransferase
MSELHTAFATCPKGIEALLRQELDELGARDSRETVAGVQFRAETGDLYRICLWSRLANRILLSLAELDMPDDTALYEGVKAIRWQDHMTPEVTFAMDFTGRTPAIRNSQYGALKAKDALVDGFRERCGRRPSVDTVAPGLRINIRARGERATVSLDLCGESLHRRGYRRAGGAAPVKENLAAALLLRADWPAIAAAGGTLLDPLCGSGTLLIEGAWMAMGIATGLQRERWGFDHWLGHDPDAWRDVKDAAVALRDDAMSRSWPDFMGYDADGGALKGATQNIAAAGLEGRVRVYRKELGHLVRPTHKVLVPGLVIANPPYGERLGDEASLVHLYRCLGDRLKTEFDGWRGALFTGNPELGRTMGLRAVKQYRLWNGPIAARLLLFDIRSSHHVGTKHTADAHTGAVPAALGAGAEMFANRLRKNLKHLARWKRQQGIDCYRLYDADMPEYAVAVDVYGEWVHVAEYRAPADIDPAAAERRLRDVMSAIPAVLDVAPGRIVVKQRQRQKGKAQYRRQGTRSELQEVVEGDARLLVNLRDYLDTGLFLDHRPLRLALGGLCKGRRFLNLYCYTGAATVHAAVGGARASTSIDLSATYLDWARRNLALNGISESRHNLVREDCQAWLRGNRESFDVILLDPPTFSNSKSTETDLDVQRDHALLIDAAMKNLDPGGLLVFSTNRRGFKLEEGLSDRLAVEDRTAWSLDRDFSRGRPIHQCWFIRHRWPGRDGSPQSEGGAPGMGPDNPWHRA